MRKLGLDFAGGRRFNPRGSLVLALALATLAGLAADRYDTHRQREQLRAQERLAFARRPPVAGPESAPAGAPLASPGGLQRTAHVRGEGAEGGAAPIADPPRRSGSAKESGLAEVAAARAALLQINLPWDSLFAGLESAVDKDVALLAVHPEARTGLVRIFAEARNLNRMLAFHRRIEASGVLQQAALSNHELAAQDPERPIRFNLTAVWKIEHALP